MLGCSIKRFSIGLVSTLIVVNPPAVKHGGGVINQLSSIGHDSNWMKQDSLASGKCSKGDDKQEKTGELSVVDASTMSASSTEQLVQVSAVGDNSAVDRNPGMLVIAGGRKQHSCTCQKRDMKKIRKKKAKEEHPVSTYVSFYFLKAGEGKRELPDKPY